MKLVSKYSTPLLQVNCNMSRILEDALKRLCEVEKTERLFRILEDTFKSVSRTDFEIHREVGRTTPLVLWHSVPNSCEHVTIRALRLVLHQNKNTRNHMVLIFVVNYVQLRK